MTEPCCERDDDRDGNCPIHRAPGVFRNGQRTEPVDLEALPKVMQQNPRTGEWEAAIPLPFYYGLIPWLWLRLTGWRDEYGRKAALLKPWED